MSVNTSTSPEVLKNRLKGVIAFPVTTFKKDYSLDWDGLSFNANWLSESGIAAIVAPSGTGEAFSLTPSECSEVTKVTARAVAGRKPLLAAVGFSSAVGAEQARLAEANGADGIMILPPYYAHPGPEGLMQYYREIAAATSLGVVIYVRDSAIPTPESVVLMTQKIPNLIALKDGGGNVRLFRRYHEHVTNESGADRLAWLGGVGDDLVAPYFAAGAQGFTSSVACFWPEGSVELYRLAATGDTEGLAAFHSWAIQPLYEFRHRGQGLEVSVMKAAMEILGLPAGPVRAPLASMTGKDREALAAVLANIGVPDANRRKQNGGKPIESDIRSRYLPQRRRVDA